MESSYGNTINLARLFEIRPTAIANLMGSPKNPDIRGIVYFHQTTLGVVVTAEVFGLPFERGNCKEEIFAFHIHDGRSCTGNATDPLANTGGHYNPHNCRHPQHAGDLPPLFGNEGFAWMSVLTQRLTVNEVMGRTVIVHRMPDDFTTQPAGNSGERIACGVIHR